jgi:hypothetical protein
MSSYVLVLLSGVRWSDVLMHRCECAAILYCNGLCLSRHIPVIETGRQWLQTRSTPACSVQSC